MSSAAFPMLSTAQALQLLAERSLMSQTELEGVAGPELEGASFYPLASSRVTVSELQELRNAVVACAGRHGYPNPQPPAARRSFDQELVEVLHSTMSVVRADAADDRVWSYLSLQLCPDVAFWRYPTGRGAEPVGDGDIDRLLGGVRHVFGRLWWRAEILTPEIARSLLEDEAVGLLERPTIGGYPSLARAVAARQLRATETLRGVKRQDIFRDVLKRLRREMGFTSVYMLDHGQIETMIDDLFDTSVAAIAGNPDPRYELESSTEIFVRLCGESWAEVSALMAEPRWGEVLILREQAASYLAGDAEKSMLATRLAADVSFLLESWHDWTIEERTIAAAALRYFLLAQDSTPDDQPDGLADDDRVVGAAFSALRVSRPTGVTP